MIRLIQRRLIVPRGDTGTFSIPVLAGKDTGDVSIFTIFDPLMHRKIFEKVMTISGETLTIEFTHGDTVNLPVGQYVWDIKFYTEPIFAEEKLIGGTEVDSYYAAFTLPICEIRETGDNLLMSDDAPTGALKSGQIDFVTASINEMTSLKNTTTIRAAEADTSAQNAAASAQDALDSKVAALAAEQTATSAAQSAQASATLAAEKADQIATDLQNKADKSEIPTLVSQLENDSGYLTQEADPTVPAWAKAQNKPTYTATEVGAPTVQEMNTALNSKLESITVNFTATKDEQTKVITVTSDTTIADIITAHQAGKVIFGILTHGQGMTLSGYVNVINIEIAPDYTTTMIELCVGMANLTLEIRGVRMADQDQWGFISSYQLLANEEDVGFDASSLKIMNLGTPTNNKDAANKKYVDDTVAAFTETDPTVPSWAKAQTKPTYTASEVGAPTVQEMNSALANKLDNKFIVEFTVSWENNEMNVLSNKTIDEILEAASQGRLIEGGLIGIYQFTFNIIEGVLCFSCLYSNIILNIIGQKINNEDEWTLINTISMAANIADPNPSYTAGGMKIIALGTPTANTDAANKKYVDDTVGAAIGNVHQFELSIQQSLPTQDIDTHTIYLIPKTGETNDVYDEYVYINNAWEMIGNTQIDLSNYATIPDMNKKAPAIYTIGASPITNAVPNIPFKSLILTIAGDPTDVGTSSASVTVGPSTTVAEGTTYTKSFDPIYEGTLDFVSGKLTITKAILNLGSIGYNYDDTYHYFYSQALYGIIDTDDPIYSSDMTVHTVEEIQSGEEGVAFGGATYIYVYDDEYVGLTIDEFKAAVAGKCIAYTLRTPRIVELGAAEIRTLEGTTYVMSDDGAVNVEYQVDTKSYIDTNIPSVPVQDVQVNGTSILSNNIANITSEAIGASNTYGIGTITVSNIKHLKITQASSYAIKIGNNNYQTITPTMQHEATFYGLAKVAGADMKDSSNAVGTYTDAAKQAIQNMLGITSLLSTEEVATATAAHAANSLFLMGGKLHKATSAIAVGDAVETGTNCQVVKADEVFVKDTDYATASTPGVISVGYGLFVGSSGTLYVNAADSAQIKTGTNGYNPITPMKQHEAAFYGLAKASGDITQAQSNNAVGTYTTTAATAIKTMLQIQEGLEVVRLV